MISPARDARLSITLSSVWPHRGQRMINCVLRLTVHIITEEVEPGQSFERACIGRGELKTVGLFGKNQGCGLVFCGRGLVFCHF
jgi:hypothetical protein